MRRARTGSGRRAGRMHWKSEAASCVPRRHRGMASPAPMRCPLKIGRPGKSRRPRPVGRVAGRAGGASAPQKRARADVGAERELWWAWARGGCRLVLCEGADRLIKHRGNLPSGNRPVSPVSVFLPRYQPSPKSSSRSISSMRSPRARLSSSGLRAWNSSVRRRQRCGS
jgi:hypothetical protein